MGLRIPLRVEPLRTIDLGQISMCDAAFIARFARTPDECVRGYMSCVGADAFVRAASEASV